MGNCNTGTCGGKDLEAEDPKIDVHDQPVVDYTPHPAPFTVDLDKPDVDVDAPLDTRDIALVQQTFARVAMLGDEHVGWILFTNIFEIAPEAKALFPFFNSGEEDTAKMRSHGAKVVGTVATAVSLLNDLDTLVPILKSLGLRHKGYSVIPAHYDVVGQALIKSLQTALGVHMTPAVTNAYLKVYTIMSKTMMEPCDYPPPEVEEPEPEMPQTPITPVPGAARVPDHLDIDSVAEAQEAEAAEAVQATGEPAASPAPAVTSEDKATEPEVAKAQEEKAEDPAPTKEAEEVKGEKKKSAAKKTAVKKRTEHANKAKKTDDAEKKKNGDEKSASAKAEANPAEKKKNGDEKSASATAEANPEEKKQGPTPEEQLLAAAAAGDDKTVAKLLKSGVNVNVADSDGKTALHMAAEKGYEELCGRITMAKKVKLSMKMVSTKETPLHRACKEGHKECAVLIVRGGAEVHPKNKAGKTPAEVSSDKQLALWLQGNNPAGTTPPWQGKKMK